MSGFAATPEPPYWMVVFTSVRSAGNDADYAEAAATMERLARRQPGFLGLESVRDPGTGFGITVSYWTDEDAIAAWRAHAEHAVIQRLGRERWYRAYRLRTGRVERAATWDTD